MPTLLICGEDDKVTPIAETRIVEQGIAGSKVALIPQAGHLCYIEKPDAFNQHVLTFLQPLNREAQKEEAQ
jgi:pimeloyl-ACP methyl ester carboxylesterase